ncbi:MAG: hypothetical protein KC561_09415 [Myxococcales bacterium]|nr:hypothetical protein [Myxococcales bacterium]
MMKTAAPTQNTWLKTVGLGFGILIVVAAMIGGALTLAGVLTPDPKSCSDMASGVHSTTRNLRTVDIVIGLAGNGPAVAAEAQQHVRSVLHAEEPDAATLVKVTLVNGDREYQPSGTSGQCVGQELLVAPSTADLESYRTASVDAKADVEAALRKQYDTQAGLVAASVRTAVSQAPPPDSPNTGAFALWPFVAQIPADHEAFVLGPLTVGGDNCLTLASPASIASDGKSTEIAQRVAQCVAAGEVSKASATSLTVEGVGSLTLTGSQRDAQNAVVDALCSNAAETKCTE